MNFRSKLGPTIVLRIDNYEGVVVPLYIGALPPVQCGEALEAKRRSESTGFALTCPTQRALSPLEIM